MPRYWPEDAPSRAELAADAEADATADLARRLALAAPFFTPSEYETLKDALIAHAEGAEDVADPDDEVSLACARLMARFGEAATDLHPEGVGTHVHLGAPTLPPVHVAPPSPDGDYPF